MLRLILYYVVAWLYHIEPTWSDGYLHIGNTTFDQLCERVANHIELSGYDRVILTQFEYDSQMLAYPYDHIRHLIDDVYEYGYGLTLDCFGFDDDDIPAIQDKIDSGVIYPINNNGYYIVKGGYHSEIVTVDSWMLELKECNVSLCGAFDGECVEDISLALDAAGIPFQRVESLII